MGLIKERNIGYNWKENVKHRVVRMTENDIRGIDF